MIISDEKTLRAKNEPVTPEEAESLISLLESELKNSEVMGRPGIGLACPQIGINKKAAIIRINESIKIDLVNATIKNSYGLAVFKDEGCLSFPDQLKDTERYQEIYITNNLVEPHSFVARGLIAVAIQHELDHLDGILFGDREFKQTVVQKSKNRPNDPCNCGSGKKYKKCSLNLLRK